VKISNISIFLGLCNYSYRFLIAKAKNSFGVGADM
jgi:hypothetical protein